MVEVGDGKGLFIVRRDQPDLFEHLRVHFSADPEVQVLWDRRTRERRTESFRITPDRRRGERRGVLPESWSYPGFAFVPGVLLQ